MNRPAHYAKHTGRRHRKTKSEHQMGLDVDVAFYETVMIEFRLWCERQRAAGAEGFTLCQFRAEAKSVPNDANAWGSLAKNVIAREPGIRVDGHVRSKVPAAHRRLVNFYRFESPAT